VLPSRGHGIDTQEGAHQLWPKDRIVLEGAVQGACPWGERLPLLSAIRGHSVAIRGVLYVVLFASLTKSSQMFVVC
jgi:hypothetical protein